MSAEDLQETWVCLVMVVDGCCLVGLLLLIGCLWLLLVGLLLVVVVVVWLLLVGLFSDGCFVDGCLWLFCCC